MPRNYTAQDYQFDYENLNGPLCLVHGTTNCDCCPDCGAQEDDNHEDYCVEVER